MKSTQNREQVLFLAAGGVIMVMIVAVVVFNMVRNDNTGLVMEDVTPRPVVKMTPLQASEPESSSAPAAAWSAVARPAKVFENSPPPLVPSKELGAVPARLPPLEEQRVAENADAAPPPEEDNAPEFEPRPATVARRAPEPVRTPVSAPVAVPVPPPPVATTTLQVARQTPPSMPAPMMTPPARPVAPVPVAPVTASVGSEGTYLVNLGSFSTEQNALAMYRRVAALPFEGRKLPAYQETAQVNGRTYFRVRAGPFASRDEADRAARLVRQQGGIDGQVLSGGR